MEVEKRGLHGLSLFQGEHHAYHICLGLSRCYGRFGGLSRNSRLPSQRRTGSSEYICQTP